MQNNPHEHFFSISGSVMFSKNSSLHYFFCVDYKQPDKEDAQLSWLLMLCCVVMFCQSGCPCFFCPWEADIHCSYKIFCFFKAVLQVLLMDTHTKNKNTSPAELWPTLDNFPTDLGPFSLTNSCLFLSPWAQVLSGSSSGFLSSCVELFRCALDLLYIFWHKVKECVFVCQQHSNAKTNSWQDWG